MISHIHLKFMYKYIILDPFSCIIWLPFVTVKDHVMHCFCFLFAAVCVSSCCMCAKAKSPNHHATGQCKTTNNFLCYLTSRAFRVVHSETGYSHIYLCVLRLFAFITSAMPSKVRCGINSFNACKATEVYARQRRELWLYTTEGLFIYVVSARPGSTLLGCSGFP